MSKGLVKTVQRGQIRKGFRPKVEDEQRDSDLLEELEEELWRDGIKLFDNENINEAYLQLPSDLTEVESKELGKYFSNFTMQKVYVRSLIGRTRTLLRELTDKLDNIRSNVYTGLPAKMSVTEKELNLRSHEKYGEESKKLMHDISFLSEKHKMLDDYLESLIDIIFSVSREISRRSGDLGDFSRGENMGKRR